MRKILGKTLFENIIFSSDLGDLSRHAETIAQESGFTGFSYYASIPRADGKPLVFNTSSSEVWRDCYQKKNYKDIDPQLRYCEREFTYTFWDRSFYKTHNEQALYDDSYRYGIRGGLLLPIHGSATEVAMFSLNTDALSLDSYKNRIDLIGHSLNLAVFFHQSARRLLMDSAGKTKAIRLSNQQKNCLRLASQGLTSSLIAEKLSISENTVNSYFKTIFEKLNVTSRNQAFAVAMNRGMLN